MAWWREDGPRARGEFSLRGAVPQVLIDGHGAGGCGPIRAGGAAAWYWARFFFSTGGAAGEKASWFVLANAGNWAKLGLRNPVVFDSASRVRGPCPHQPG